MLAVTLPIALMAGMTLCAALFHAIVTLRSGSEKVELAFALTSLGAFAYDLCEIALYLAPDSASARPILEMLYGVGYTTMGAFVIAIERYGRRPIAPWATWLVAVCAALGVAAYINPWSLALTDEPSTLVVPMGSGTIVVHEVVPGPIVNGLLLAIAFLAMRVLVLARALFREGDRARAFSLGVSGTLFVAAMTNDMLVFQRVYASIYLAEYAYSFIVLLMIASSAQEVVGARRAELRLKASDERLRATLTSIGDAVLVVDERRMITDLNPAAERLFGKRERLIGEHLRAVCEMSGLSRQDAEQAAQSIVTLVIGSALAGTPEPCVSFGLHSILHGIDARLAAGPTGDGTRGRRS